MWLTDVAATSDARYGSSASCFIKNLAYRRSAATLLGFFAVTMTEVIAALAGGFLRTLRGGLAYTMRGGLSLVMVNPMPGGRCRRQDALTADPAGP